ncbi:MAG: hypothetical protein R3C69_09640 [Geminicoccaceae bacterium]
MAEALAMASRAGDGGEAIASYFEVHVLRDERWVIDCTSPSAEDALANAQDLARRAEVLGVKVIHERYNPQTDQSAARVVYSAIKPQRPKGRRLPPIAAPAARPTTTPVHHPDDNALSADPASENPPSEMPPSIPATPGRPVVYREPPRETGSWQLFAWASLALAVTASLLFVLLLLAG